MSAPAPEASLLTSPKQKLDRPAIARRVLPNGLTLLVLEDPSHPLVAFHAVVRIGSATEGPFFGTGISHVVEHMLFKGTARRPVGAVEQEARAYGGTSQGSTTYDTTSYQLTANKESWSQAADLLVDALFFSTLDPEEFSKERQVVLREMKMRRDDPDQVAWDLLFENAYRVHPYRSPIIGMEDLLIRMTREDVATYHRMHYLPNALVIAVVGDVKAQEVEKRFEELTAQIRPGPVPPQALPEEPMPLSPREISQEAQVAHGIATVGFPSVPLTSPDLYALDLLSALLGGGRGSRLDKALKETGIVHSVSCFNYTPLDRGLLIVSMRMDPEKMPKAIQELYSQLAQARETLFPSAEVEEIKRAFLRGYLSDRQTVGGQASDLSTYETLVGDAAFSTRYIEEIQRIGPEDLRRVAGKFLNPEVATTVKLFPMGALASRKMESPSVSASGSKAEKVVLANGFRVLLKKDSRIPLVDFQISMRGGVRCETKENNGISVLTCRMLLRGTGSRSAQQIIDLIKEMGGQVEPISGRNSLGLGMEVVRSEQQRAAELLGDLISNPVFPQEELEKERHLALAGLEASEEDPFPWGMRRLVSLLFSVHPYRLDPAGNRESISRLTRADLDRFYKRIRDPKQMVISVVGDFDRAQMLARLEQTLGTLPPAQGEDFSVPAEPPLTSLREREETAQRKEALVLIGFPGIRATDPRAPALDLVETILSGGAGRLFTEVRERRGLAYTVGAFSVYGMDPGAFILYALTDPSQLQKVRKAMVEEARRLGTSPVPEEEFRRAREGLLGARRFARQTQSAQASHMSVDELVGLGYDYSERYEAAVKAATPQEIQSVAKALLDPQRCVVLIGQPAHLTAGSSENSKPVESQSVTLRHSRLPGGQAGEKPALDQVEGRNP